MWDAESNEALLFNRFVGAAALAEYVPADRNLEIIRGNEEFQQMFARTSGTYERYGTNLLNAVDREELDDFAGELDRLIREGGEGERELRLGKRGRAGRWVRVRLRMLSNEGKVSVLFLRFEETPRQQRLLDMQADLEKRLYDAIPCGIVRYTPEERPRILLLNRAACDMFGCADLDEYLALAGDDPLAPLLEEGMQDQLRVVEELKAGAASVPFTCKARRFDGAPLWLEGTSSLAEEEGLLVVQSAFNEMAEYRARQHERLMRDYVDALCAAYDEVFEIDCRRETSRLLHSRYRPHEDAPSLPLDEALERWGTLIHDEDGRRRMKDALGDAMASHSARPSICSYAMTAGENTIWCQTTFIRMAGDYLLCCNKDVTEGVTAADRRSLSRLIDVIRKLPVGVGVFRVARGYVYPQYVSDQACSILGIPLDDCSRLVALHEPLPLREEIERALEGISVDEALARGVEKEVELPRRDGTRSSIRLRAQVERDGEDLVAYAVVVDVTDEVRERKASAWSNERYRLLCEMTNAISFDYDSHSDSVQLYINRTGHGMEAQVIEHYLETFSEIRACVLHPDFLEEAQGVFHRVRRGSESETLEYLADYYGLGYEWYRANLFVVHDGDGCWHLMGLIDNIQGERDLRKQAEYDGVTGLTNHVTTKKLVNAALADPALRGRCVCAVIDIDDFKMVNDRCGHIEGDILLHELGALLRSSFREGDVVGRVGGDEFVVLLKNIALDTAVAKLEEVAERIPRCVGANLADPLSVSVGAYATTAADRTYSDVVEKADTALYRVKRTGKNRVAVHA